MLNIIISDQNIVSSIPLQISINVNNQSSRKRSVISTHHISQQFFSSMKISTIDYPYAVHCYISSSAAPCSAVVAWHMERTFVNEPTIARKHKIFNRGLYIPSH